MKNKLKMKYCQRRTNKIVWRHDIGRSKQRWSTKTRNRRLRRCFDSSRISLVFQCFWHLVGEKVSENQKGEKKKTKSTFPIFWCPLSLPFLLFMFYFFLSFFLSLFLSLSFFHYLKSISFLYLSFFFSLLSLWAKKITKITEIIENHRNQNHQKYPETP